MSTLRIFRRELSRNVRCSLNISPAKRNIAISMLNASYTASKVANACSRAELTIRRLRAKVTTTGTIQDKPRSGRLQILLRHARKLVYRAVRKNPKITYAELAKIT
jgi:hypothetical protein